MFIDANLLVCDAQAFTATAVSTSSVDFGNTTPKRQVGDGEGIGLMIQVDVAADNTTGDETYSFELIQSAAAALTTPTILAREAYIASGAMISTLLVVGFLIYLPMPMGYPIQRYVGFNLTAGGTTPTITLTAWLGPRTFASVKQATYAKGYVIS
ncbi:MAG: hypothetical protein PHC88_05650 [Terrimicrobiaceae bacterium]|nr:hypothetical protein [Terrimicrobiaceae bacterium]